MSSESTQLVLPNVDASALAAWWWSTFDQAVEIWEAGGWAMYALAFVALLLFATATHLWMMLNERGFLTVRERTWRRWIVERKERRGPVGDLMNFADSDGTAGDLHELFRQMRVAELVPFDRELRVVRVCVTAAPLLGLLGTVTGMLTTFGALATGSGGEKTMGLIAAGISEALITTQTGLVIALVGLFMQYQLVRKVERYRAFLAQLETAFIQTRHELDRPAPLDADRSSSRGAGQTPVAAGMELA